MITNLYFYNAWVKSVYDGDTITVDIDLGCGIWKKNERIRLFGINTPEIRGSEREDGLKSKYWLVNKIEQKEIILQTIKDKHGKYGRLLGVIWLDDQNINELIVVEGYAEKKEY